MIIALQHREVAQAVLIQINKRRIGAPTCLRQIHFVGNVLQFGPARILVKDRLFRALRRRPSSTVRTVSGTIESASVTLAWRRLNRARVSGDHSGTLPTGGHRVSNSRSGYGL